VSVEWFLKLKEIDSLTKQRSKQLLAQNEQNERLAKLKDRLNQGNLQTATLKKTHIELLQTMSEVEKKLATASQQKQRVLDIGGADQKVQEFGQEIERLEEQGLELLQSLEASEQELQENKTFLIGLEKTIQEIQQESQVEVEALESEIKNLDLRILLLKEELPTEFKNILEKITGKNLAHGPFTRIEQGSCYFCRYKISRLEESDIDMSKSLKICPQCSRIFLPYGS
jgi:predicted  nucleic acid-binding Zn-ribbon protein